MKTLGKNKAKITGEKIKEFLSNDKQSNDLKEIEKQNLWIKSFLKELNQQLAILLQKNEKKFLIKKPKKKVATLEETLEVLEKQIENDNDVLQRYKKEKDLFEKRCEVVKNENYFFELTDKIEEVKKEIEIIRKDLPNIKDKEYKNGRKLDIINNHDGVPDSILIANEKTSDIALEIAKQKKLTQRFEHLNEKLKNLQENETEVELKLLDIQEKAIDKNIYLNSKAHEQKYLELTEEYENLKKKINQFEKCKKNLLELSESDLNKIKNILKDKDDEINTLQLNIMENRKYLQDLSNSSFKDNNLKTFLTELKNKSPIIPQIKNNLANNNKKSQQSFKINKKKGNNKSKSKDKERNIFQDKKFLDDVNFNNKKNEKKEKSEKSLEKMLDDINNSNEEGTDVRILDEKTSEKENISERIISENNININEKENKKDSFEFYESDKEKNEENNEKKNIFDDKKERENEKLKERKDIYENNDFFNDIENNFNDNERNDILHNDSEKNERNLDIDSIVKNERNLDIDRNSEKNERNLEIDRNSEKNERNLDIDRIDRNIEQNERNLDIDTNSEKNEERNLDYDRNSEKNERNLEIDRNIEQNERNLEIDRNSEKNERNLEIDKNKIESDKEKNKKTNEKNNDFFNDFEDNFDDNDPLNSKTSNKNKNSIKNNNDLLDDLENLDFPSDHSNKNISKPFNGEGKLFVNIIGAKKLNTNECDYYCKANLSSISTKTIKTKTIENQWNPQWKHSDVFKLKTNENEAKQLKLLVEVFDEDFWNDDLIASGIIEIFEVFKYSGEWINKFYPLFDKKGNNAGEIYLQMQWRANGEEFDENSCENLMENCSFSEDVGRKNVKNFEEIEGKVNGVLWVNVFSAENLKDEDTFGKSDPFSIIEIEKKGFILANKKIVTNYIEDNLNPVWNYKDSLKLSLDKDEIDQLFLVVKVYDYDYSSNDLLGIGKVSLEKCIEGGEKVVEKISLQDDKGRDVNGKVNIEMEWVNFK